MKLKVGSKVKLNKKVLKKYSDAHGSYNFDMPHGVGKIVLQNNKVKHNCFVIRRDKWLCSMVTGCEKCRPTNNKCGTWWCEDFLDIVNE